MQRLLTGWVRLIGPDPGMKELKSISEGEGFGECQSQNMGS